MYETKLDLCLQPKQLLRYCAEGAYRIAKEATPYRIASCLLTSSRVSAIHTPHNPTRATSNRQLSATLAD